MTSKTKINASIDVFSALKRLFHVFYVVVFFLFCFSVVFDWTFLKNHIKCMNNDQIYFSALSVFSGPSEEV